jgi:hypothetical protein
MNWDYIKEKESPLDLRDHLARFPSGVTKRMARERLEALVWAGLGEAPDLAALKDFLAEFPDGEHAEEAKGRQKELEQEVAAEQQRLAQETEAERQEAERDRQQIEAWAAASATDSIETYKSFLATWPHSNHAVAARARVKELKGRPTRRWVLQGAGAAGALAFVGGAVAWLARDRQPNNPRRTTRSARSRGTAIRSTRSHFPPTARGSFRAVTIRHSSFGIRKPDKSCGPSDPFTQFCPSQSRQMAAGHSPAPGIRAPPCGCGTWKRAT